jgi:transposase-like protein
MENTLIASKANCKLANVPSGIENAAQHSSRIMLHIPPSGGVQRYFCSNCIHSFQAEYVYLSCQICEEQITRLLKESCGIRSIGRLLGISPR